MSKTEDLLLHGVITRGGMQTGRSFLMPPWGGNLTERDRWDLIAHIRTLRTDVRRLTHQGP
ncbi:MAG: cytochrome c [Planctomycetes bacterium]|nr:cytochrome c [Planctomycetota bacterium]